MTLHPSQWLGGVHNNTPVALLFEHCDIVQAGSPVLYSLACAQGPPSYPYFGCERVCLKRRVMVTLYRYRHMRARCDGIRLSSEGRCYRTVLNVQSDWIDVLHWYLRDLHTFRPRGSLKSIIGFCPAVTQQVRQEGSTVPVRAIQRYSLHCVVPWVELVPETNRHCVLKGCSIVSKEFHVCTNWLRL